jgi:hypothetical protein
MWIEADNEAALIASVADTLLRQAQATKDPTKRRRLFSLERAHREMLSAFHSSGVDSASAAEPAQTFRAAA